MNPRNKAHVKSINLALQGGGAHGAFTWGVLDRILEDGRLWIDAISGTSAGAMNAVVVADGLMRNGCEGARETLHEFWWEVSRAARFSPVQRAPLDMFMGNWSLDGSPGYIFVDFLSRMASPYELNPWKINPLAEILEKTVDFERVRSCEQTKVFVSATNVETGRVRVFDPNALTSDMVMASACLPYMFQAVEVDGVPYWDGGFMGNPVLFPFYDSTECRDILIVQINPIERKGVPRTARDILNRINEITFNGSLLKELRSVDFVRRLIEQGKLDPEQYKQLNIHIVEAQDKLAPLGASSKVNSEWAFLRHLFEIGRQAADLWLERNFEDIGQRSTVDLRAMFQGIGAEHHG
ncbi:MAG: patatin-like phospholipase family protein [Alphaproteobacteria bacterium]|nr:patatin-like phospholipase family protein [Alphaproteobacteria bacterium]